MRRAEFNVSLILSMIMMRCIVSLAFSSLLIAGASAQQGWLCYGGNAQHSATWTGTSQSAALIKWQAPLDDNRSYYGGEVLAHFAAPMVTPTNTVVHGFRFTTQEAGQNDYDNWSVIGRSGATGQQIWTLNTDFSAALIVPNDWTTVFPITLFQGITPNSRGVAAAASGGSIMVRASADQTNSMTKRIVFYTTLADFTQNQAAYAPIKINTPLTADSLGNIYFGYWVSSGVPSNVAASLGTGGIAKVNVNTGACIYQSVEAMNFDTNLSRPAMNAAPALTTDGTSIYVALAGNDNVLAKLATKTLKVTDHVLLIDPSVPGQQALLINESSASPMIGPDGHVFMGVFGNQWRESHGWMLQFDENLSPTEVVNKKTVTFPAGAFGWDDTACVVPSNIVPTYKGKAKYLILTKYNNYDDDGGDPGADGSNHIAVLDPTSNTISKDRQSKIPVMNEVMTVLGPTLTNDDPAHPNARNEWCINSAAIDVNRKCAVINSEDGHMYIWDLVNNTLIEGLSLAPATGEAYTETAIGPDGQIYVINNTIMFAIGGNNASSLSLVQGSSPSGSVKSLWYLDGSEYSAESVKTTAGQSITVEADFTLNTPNATTLTVAGAATAVKGTQGIVTVYNYSTKAFDTLNTGTLSATATNFNLTLSSEVANYVGTGGKVRIRVQALVAPSVSKNKFKLSLDLLSCGLS